VTGCEKAFFHTPFFILDTRTWSGRLTDQPLQLVGDCRTVDSLLKVRSLLTSLTSDISSERSERI
jgi:hypothetical protein